jgi:hypothetical protein
MSLARRMCLIHTRGEPNTVAPVLLLSTRRLISGPLSARKLFVLFSMLNRDEVTDLMLDWIWKIGGKILA